MTSPETTADTQQPVFWERLRRLFSRSREAEARRRPSANGIAVVFCVLISCLLWFIFTMQEDYTAVLEVPTRVANLPADEALAEAPPATARVEVRGEGFQLMRFAFDPPALPIDAAAGQIDLSAVLDLPQGVSLLNVTPRRLNVQKEPRVTRRVPVRLRATITTPATHALVEPPRLAPDSVAVSGAASLVESLAYWPTERLSVRDLRDTLSTPVALADTLGGLVRRTPDAVRVLARARQYTEGTREIDVRIPGSPERSVTLEPSSVEVRYRVPVEQHAAAQEAEGFFATVSYDALRADTTGRVRPELVLPAGLDIRDVRMTPPALRYYTFVPDE